MKGTNTLLLSCPPVIFRVCRLDATEWGHSVCPLNFKDGRKQTFVGCSGFSSLLPCSLNSSINFSSSLKMCCCFLLAGFKPIDLCYSFAFWNKVKKSMTVRWMQTQTTSSSLHPHAWLLLAEFWAKYLHSISEPQMIITSSYFQSFARLCNTLSYKTQKLSNFGKMVKKDKIDSVTFYHVVTLNIYLNV